MLSGQLDKLHDAVRYNELSNWSSFYEWLDLSRVVPTTFLAAIVGYAPLPTIRSGSRPDKPLP